jgi:hypothetical protein
MTIISDLFYVYTGSKLDFGKQELNENGINFVSRNSNNNGVVGKVEFQNCMKKYNKGDITVPLGGSYLLSAFVQDEDFVTAQNVAVIRPKKEMKKIEKWFYCYVLRENRFKFSAFGREVNKYIKDIKIPNTIPTWVYKVNTNKLETGNTKQEIDLNVDEWEYFNIHRLFKVRAGKYYYSYEYDLGVTPYISATKQNNGIGKRINLDPDFREHCITTEKISCTAFYQKENFCATSDVNIIKPRKNISEATGIFISTIINFNENFRWNYGRQCRVGDTKKIEIKLPICKDENNNPIIDSKRDYHDRGFIPDYEFMDNYISTLPFGDNLENNKISD